MRRILRRTLNSGPTSAVRRGIRLAIRNHMRLIAMAVVASLLLASLTASAGTKEVVNRQSRTHAQATISLPSQLYRSVSTTVASIGSWMASFIATESSANSSPYQPVAAHITPAPAFIDAPANLTVTAAASNSISLSWTAPSGTVNHYVLERSENIQGPFFFVANVTGATTKSDTSVTNLHAYLYRVRAVSNTGVISPPSNMALGTAISFQFSSLQGQEIRAQHFYDVRTAINLVRALGNVPAESWDRSNLGGLEVKADDVNEMRTALNAALTELSIPVTAYTDPTLNVGTNGTLVKGIHIEQLQSRATKGSSTSFGPIDSDSSSARLDPLNQTGGGGENPLSRNFNWNLPLLRLPGRAGMDLGLTLSYNSLVWTKIDTSSISFDDDNGFPGPGFRLGFPVIQQLYYNAQVGKLAFLLINPDGSRTELRQVDDPNTPNLYESADSSHLLFNSTSMILRASNGTQLSYALHGGEFKCTKIKDRNGNVITVSYTDGRINTITDTLNRVITFNYDNGWLTSITQVWNQGLPNQVTHNWARFEYSNTPFDYNFGNLLVYGPPDNTTIKTLSRIKLADDSYFDFAYTNWGQVWKVTSFASDNSVINYRSYDLPTGTALHNDCPRFQTRKDWAKYWNGDTNGTTAVNEEVATATFIIPESATWTMPEDTQSVDGMRAQVTTPDGTVNKIYYIGVAGQTSGWRRGLVALVDTFTGGPDPVRRVSTTWIQDNMTAPYPVNPRVAESNVRDLEGNRARKEFTYEEFDLGNEMSCHLPRDVYEYAANATTRLRSIRTLYNMSSTYKNLRILGLVSETQVYEGDVNGTLVSKVAYFYDDENASSSIVGADAPVRHENPSFVNGRGNLSSVRRYDVDNITQFTTTRTKYNTAGAVVSRIDAVDDATMYSYADSFSDNNNSRNTLAYPTTTTDPDGYTTTSKYNFDFGAITYKRTPLPNVTTNSPGPEQSLTFDVLGRLEKVTNLVNNAHTRFEYSPSKIRVDSYSTIQEGQGEAHSFGITDGAGRTIATARDHPGSDGGFSGQKTIYDQMGRAIKVSNPTETSASGHPSQWNTAGDDESAGWIYVEQTYDWLGRPLITTNQDGTTKTASYSGCGCAGGQVVTVTDEGTIDATGATKKRQYKTYSDVLGRVVKSEILHWQGGSVYSATVNTYNARDQLLHMTRYEGPVGSAIHQETDITYDGYGRVKTKHMPEQDENKFTTWTYNADDTLSVITDPRGATSTFAYNNSRKLVNTATYELTGKPTITLSYTYDSVGNRKSMTDPSGTTSFSYNSLGQMISETREFTGMPGQSFTMGYEYNLGGEVKKFTLPTQFGTTVSYGYDRAGRLSGVTNTGYTYSDPNIIETAVEVPMPTFLSNMSYRAWNDLKGMDNEAGAHVQFSYNARLLPSSYAITELNQGGSMSWNYGYHPDGTIRLASDVADTDFDRKYEYDVVGRLIEAYSGREARGEAPSFPTPDSPYRQTNSYDVFGNHLQQTGRIWQKNLSGDVFTYTNNRRTGLTYDEAGHVIVDPQGMHVFDAQGQRSAVTAGTVGGGQTGHPVMPAEETATTYNGQGHPSIVTTTIRTEELIGEGPQTNISTSSGSVFYLRSTVLNAVIAEMNSQGQRSRELVYAGGVLIAEWHITPWNDSIAFQLKNPITGTWITNWAPFNDAHRTELDPSGRVTGNEPFFIPPEPPEPEETREPTYYLIEGGPTIEAELGMQLYEDRYINKVFGDSAGPGQGNYSGDRWREWQMEREFQLRTGQRFLFGIDKMNANVPGSYEWVDDWVSYDDGAAITYTPEGVPIVPSLVTVNRGYYRLIPSQQRRSDISEPTSRIRVINTGGETALEKNIDKVLRKIEWMVNNGNCSAAFKKYGLATPFDMVNNGLITLSSVVALNSSDYNQVLGEALGTTGGTLPNNVRIQMRDDDGPARTLRNDRTGKVIIFFAPDAFTDQAYFDEAPPHEFIHAGGQGRKYSFFGYFFGHDLSGFNQEAYAEIMANCKDH
jgi:YD repeat-containing protein